MKAERAGKASKGVVVISSLVMGSCPARRSDRSLVVRLLARAAAQRLFQGRIVDGEAIARLQAGNVFTQNVGLQLARKLVFQALGLLHRGRRCRRDLGDAEDNAPLAVRRRSRGRTALGQSER